MPITRSFTGWLDGSGGDGRIRIEHLTDKPVTKTRADLNSALGLDGTDQAGGGPPRVLVQPLSRRW